MKDHFKSAAFGRADWGLCPQTPGSGGTVSWRRIPVPFSNPPDHSIHTPDPFLQNLTHTTSAVVPGTEVPSARLLAQPPRRKPFLFSADEIGLLLKAALSLGPQASLRPHTLSTLLGLLASSGLRASEALNPTVTDLLLDLDPPRLQIRKTKFHKSRLVPIHQTVANKLR